MAKPETPDYDEMSPQDDESMLTAKKKVSSRGGKRKSKGRKRRARKRVSK